MKIIVILFVCAIFANSCQTLDSLRGSSFDPSSYGTEALKTVIRDPGSNHRDAAAAARTLASRPLQANDIEDVMALLTLDRDPRVNTALIGVMRTANSSFLRDELVNFSTQTTDPITALELHQLLVSFPETNKRDYYMGQLENSRFASVRSDSVRSLADVFDDEIEDLFIKILENEQHAGAAADICAILFEIGTAKSLPMLDQIANDINRSFVKGNMADGSAADAAAVRRYAIQAADAIRLLEA
jgi:hypothetical protein